MLSRSTPLRHAEERGSVHHNSPVAPGLCCNPFHDVVAVAPNLQSEIVSLDSSGPASAAHVYLYEYVTALDEVDEIAAATTIDVVLSEI